MGRHLTGLVPLALEEEEWEIEIAKFQAALDGDDEVAIKWLADYFRASWASCRSSAASVFWPDYAKRLKTSASIFKAG